MKRYLELKIPPAIIALLCGTSMWYLAGLVEALDLAVTNRVVISMLIAGVGVLIGVAGVVAFRAARTTVHPNRPEASSTLVTTGVYRASRNPMYLGMLLGLAGWAVYLANATAFVFLPVYILWMTEFQIKPEERVLENTFGEAFTTFRGTVRRWL